MRPSVTQADVGLLLSAQEATILGEYPPDARSFIGGIDVSSGEACVLAALFECEPDERWMAVLVLSTGATACCPCDALRRLFVVHDVHGRTDP